MRALLEIMIMAHESVAAEAKPSFWRRHRQKLLALGVWLLVLGSYQWYAWRNDLSPVEALRGVIRFVADHPLGPLLFIVVYALRPLALFSATVLTVAAGYLFGLPLGFLYSSIGSNLSAMVAYAIGRFFGQAPAVAQGDGLIQRYTARLREHSFTTVLTMRFLFLPFDVVNYLAGFLRIDWRAFLLATILGSLPGTFSFVLAGTSIKGDFTGGLPSFDLRVFGVSAVILVLSLLLSQAFKRREARAEPRKDR